MGLIICCDPGDESRLEVDSGGRLLAMDVAPGIGAGVAGVAISEEDEARLLALLLERSRDRANL